MAAGNIHRLQVVMNAAARLVTDTGRYEHITPVLRDILDRLPVQEQIIFKTAVLAFNCICETGPVTSTISAHRWRTFLGVPVCELLIVVTFLYRQLKRRLVVEVSGSQRLLYGTRFPFIFVTELSANELQFRSGLKTHSFELAYQ